MNFEELQKQSRQEVAKLKALDISLGDFAISETETMKWSGNKENYLYHGKSAINLIESCLKLLYKDKSEIKNILDFPSGHGRILRGLKTHFPESDIYACDLDARGIKFCEEEFGAIAVQSYHELKKVQFDVQFDLVWCGSLLTHVNKDQWPPIMGFFNRILNKNGILIFTYAGEFVKGMVERGDHNFITPEEAKKALDGYNESGFGFMQYETHDYEYGRTLCTPSWVRKFLDKYTNYRTVLQFERGWSARQDVIALVKQDWH